MPKISHVASTVRQGGETVWSNIGRFAKVLLARADEQQFIPAAYNLATLASLRPQRRILSPIGFRILSWLLLLLGVANVICGIVSLSVSYNLAGAYDNMSYRDGSAIWSGLIAFASGIFYLRLLRIAQMVPKRTMRTAKLVAILNGITSLIALICPVIWWIVSRDSVNSGLSAAGMVIAMLMGKSIQTQKIISEVNSNQLLLQDSLSTLFIECSEEAKRHILGLKLMLSTS